MSTMLGKRKRQEAGVEKGSKEDVSNASDSSEFDAQEIFRRHFEAQFKPLPAIKKQAPIVEDASEDEPDDETDWDGISDDEEDGVQVVEHTDAQARTAGMNKEELKKFMTSKVPQSAPSIPVLRDIVGAVIDEQDESEAANLKKDLALQRLLTESHLLDSSKNPTLTGNNRHKATDLRIQALGSKTSILTQEKMPASHRRGIIAKQSEREEKRRKEAKENGIILERAKAVGKKGNEGKRDRGVGAPNVGRFSNGTLTLSKKDIHDVEGPSRGSSAGGGRGGRGGRGGGRGRGKRVR